jgi:hypothetical protein
VAAGFFIIAWLVIGLGVDALFGMDAKSRLEMEFRARATARYTPPPSLWQRLSGSGTHARTDS